MWLSHLIVVHSAALHWLQHLNHHQYRELLWQFLLPVNYHIAVDILNAQYSSFMCWRILYETLCHRLIYKDVCHHLIINGGWQGSLCSFKSHPRFFQRWRRPGRINSTKKMLGNLVLTTVLRWAAEWWANMERSDAGGDHVGGLNCSVMLDSLLHVVLLFQSQTDCG